MNGEFEARRPQRDAESVDLSNASAATHSVTSVNQAHLGGETLPAVRAVALHRHTLTMLIENLGSVIPSELAGRLAQEPIHVTIPSPQAIRMHPAVAHDYLDSLNSHIPWKGLSKDLQKDFEVALECLSYITELLSEEKIAECSQLDSEALLSRMHVVDQCGRSFAVLCPALRTAIQAIPLPEPEKVLEPEQTVADPTKSAYSEELKASDSSVASVAEKLSPLEELRQRVLRGLHRSVTTAINAALYPFAAAWFMAGALIQKLMPKAKRKLSEKQDGKDGGVLSNKSGDGSIGNQQESGFLDRFRFKTPKLLQPSKAKSQSKQEMKLSGRSSMGAKTCLADKDHRDRTGQSPSEEVLSGLVGGRSEKRLGTIKSKDRQFSSMLGTTRVGVVVGADGYSERLDVFISKLPKQHQQQFWDTFYCNYEIVTGMDESKVPDMHSDIRLSVVEGPLSLPLPVGYQIQGVVLRDKEEKEVFSQCDFHIIECIVGGADVTIPPGVDSITYRITPVPQEERAIEGIEEMKEHFPHHEVYRDPFNKALHEQLAKIPCNDLEKALTWARQQYSTQTLTYSLDPFVGRFLRAASHQFCEAMAGLRIGSCDPFAKFACMELSNLNVLTLDIAGLVVGDDGNCFETRAGHAQAVILHEKGVKVMDLTQESCSGDSIDSTVIDWGVRSKLYSRLPKMSAPQVIEHGLRFSRIIAGNSSDELNWGQQASRRFEQFFRKDDEETFRPRLDRLHTGKLPASYQRPLTVTATVKGMDDIIEKTRKTQDSAELATYLRYRPYVSMLTSEEKKLVPDLPKACAEEDLFRRSLQVTMEILGSPSYSQKNWKALSDWLLKELPRLASPKIETHSAYSHSPAMLSSSAFTDWTPLITGLERRHLQALAPNEILTFTQCILALALDKESPPRAFKEEELQLLDSFEWSLTLLAEHLESVPVSGDVDTRVRMVTLLGSYEARRNASGLPPSQATYSLLKSAFHPSYELLIPLAVRMYHHDRTYYNRLLDPMAEVIGSVSGLLDKKRQANLKDTLGNYLIEQLKDEKVGCLSKLKWEATLKFVESTGYIPDSPRFKRDLRKLLNQRIVECRKEEEITINWPLESKPASFLTAYYDHGHHTAEFDFVKLLSRFSMCDVNSPLPAWPTYNEADLVVSFLKSLYFINQGEFDRKKDDWPAFRVAYSHGCRYVSLPDNHLIAAEVAKELPALKPLYRYYSQHRRTAFEHEAVFSQMKKSYPTQWDQGIKAMLIDSDILRDSRLPMQMGLALTREILSPFSAQEVFHGMLWYAQHVQPKSGWIKDYILSKDLGNTLPNEAQVADSMFADELPPLSKDLKLCCLLVGHSLATNEWWNGSSKNVVQRFHAATGVFRLLHRELRVPEAVRTAIVRRTSLNRDKHEIGFWRDYFYPEMRSQKLSASLQEKAQRGVRFIREKSHSPFAEYLFARTGETIVKSSGGEFRDIRPYSYGDDTRRIVWRASARQGNWQVRQFEEHESRHLTLVYDASYLLQNFNLGGKKDAPPPYGLLDMMTILQFAAEENREVDLVLYERDHIATLTGLVQTHSGSGRGRIRTDAIDEELYPLLRQINIVRRAESAILNPLTAYPAVNLFHNGVAGFSPRRITLFGLGKTNFEKSIGLVRGLKQHGHSVALLKPMGIEK